MKPTCCRCLCVLLWIATGCTYNPVRYDPITGFQTGGGVGVLCGGPLDPWMLHCGPDCDCCLTSCLCQPEPACYPAPICAPVCPPAPVCVPGCPPAPSLHADVPAGLSDSRNSAGIVHPLFAAAAVFLRRSRDDAPRRSRFLIACLYNSPVYVPPIATRPSIATRRLWVRGRFLGLRSPVRPAVPGLGRWLRAIGKPWPVRCRA